ncbi:hypothetical protein WJX73_004783 [Symbiochloris irregularis]|uniref:Uncharacterized protein n=1 Tax=Symbiochloris irregularis TaxID=706552 RepID=A0AAW1PFF3_9CHLO
MQQTLWAGLLTLPGALPKPRLHKRCAKLGLPDERGRGIADFKIDCAYSFDECLDEEFSQDTIIEHEACGHKFTIKFADQLVKLHKVYEFEQEGCSASRCIALKPTTQRIQSVTCPMCHGPFSLRHRYGRLENAASLFELDWKFSQAQARELALALDLNAQQLCEPVDGHIVDPDALLFTAAELGRILGECMSEGPSARLTREAERRGGDPVEAPGALPLKVEVQCRQHLAKCFQLLIRHCAAQAAAILRDRKFTWDEPEVAHDQAVEAFVDKPEGGPPVRRAVLYFEEGMTQLDEAIAKMERHQHWAGYATLVLDRVGLMQLQIRNLLYLDNDILCTVTLGKSLEDAKGMQQNLLQEAHDLLQLCNRLDGGPH